MMFGGCWFFGSLSLFYLFFVGKVIVWLISSSFAMAFLKHVRMFIDLSTSIKAYAFTVPVNAFPQLP